MDNQLVGVVVRNDPTNHSNQYRRNILRLPK